MILHLQGCDFLRILMSRISRKSLHILIKWLKLLFMTQRQCQPQGVCGVSMTFRSRLIGQHLQAHHVTLRPSILNLRSRCLWVLRLFVLPLCTKYEVCSISVRKILHICCVSINQPGDLDLWPLNKFMGYSYNGLPSCQFWASKAFPLLS